MNGNTGYFRLISSWNHVRPSGSFHIGKHYNLYSVAWLIYNSFVIKLFVKYWRILSFKNWNTLYTDVCPGSPNLHRHFLTTRNIWGLFTENRDGAPVTGRGYIPGIHYMAKSKFSTLAGITSASLIKLGDA